MAGDFSLPHDAHPVIRETYLYWHAARPAPDLLPGRRNIDPLNIPRLLPYIWLLEVHEPAGKERMPRLRYRLLGSHVDLGFGSSKTGLWMHEVEPDFAADPRLHGAYLAVIAEMRPNYRKGRPHFSINRGASAVERIFLPLAGDGRNVDMIFGCTIFFDSNGAELRPGL